MKKLQKLWPLLLMLLLAFALSGCGNDNTESAINCSIDIVRADGTNALNAEVAVSGTVEDAVKQACQASKLPFTIDNHMFNNFDTIASTQDEGWLLYVDGKLAQVGAHEIPLVEGMKIEFRYVNYDEAFTLE